MNWKLAVLLLCVSFVADASSLRFYGNGVNDIDRVKIRIDDPATTLPRTAGRRWHHRLHDRVLDARSVGE